MAHKKQKFDDDKLLEHAQERFSKSTQWREEHIDERWKKSNDLYDSKFTPTDKKTSNKLAGTKKLFIPKTYSHIQRILVDIMEVFFFDPRSAGCRIGKVPAPSCKSRKTYHNPFGTNIYSGQIRHCSLGKTNDS